MWKNRRYPSPLLHLKKKGKRYSVVHFLRLLKPRLMLTWRQFFDGSDNYINCVFITCISFICGIIFSTISSISPNLYFFPKFHWIFHYLVPFPNLLWRWISSPPFLAYYISHFFAQLLKIQFGLDYKLT